MIRAYATSRGHKRGGASAVHAVDEMSHLCGALDTMCGRVIVTALIGEWDPEDRDTPAGIASPPWPPWR